MPEGDTLFRAAAGLRPHLVGRPVTAARVRQPGPAIDRVVGSTVTAVESQGKNLLIRFDNGFEVRTHLRMNGSWHRYRPGESWKRAPSRARLVLEVPGSVAVCFDAPVVELFEQRAEPLHPALSALGPDLLAESFDLDAAVRRLRDPTRARDSVAEAMLDQHAVAGIGNVYRNEVLFLEGLSPFVAVGDLDDSTVRRLVTTARRLLRANAVATTALERVTTDGRAGGPLWVYRRTGRPCRRCGTPIRTTRHGVEIPRSVYWCPRCQPDRR